MADQVVVHKLEGCSLSLVVVKRMVVLDDVHLSFVNQGGLVVDSHCILHADDGEQVSLIIQVAVKVQKLDYNDVHDPAQVSGVSWVVMAI